MGEGVPTYQLRCPTCGTLYERFTLYYDRPVAEEEFSVDQAVSEIKATPASEWRRYLVCPENHMWSVKTLWRSVNHPDKVVLGEYLGVKEWA